MKFAAKVMRISSAKCQSYAAAMLNWVGNSNWSARWMTVCWSELLGRRKALMDKPSPEKVIVGPMFFRVIPKWMLSKGPVTYWIPASKATPVQLMLAIDSLMIFKLKPPLILLEKVLANATLMFIRLGLKVPIPPSGLVVVVSMISPMLNDMKERPRTLDSPTRAQRPKEEILTPVPFNQSVWVKLISNPRMAEIPATLPYMASTPLTNDMPALPQPEEAAQGLINNSGAPA